MQHSRSEVENLIDLLKLEPHPEGGWYREVYRSQESISMKCLPSRFEREHSLCTSIYYLLHDRDFSAFHRIRSDEIWHFYLGSPVKLYMLKDGERELVMLGDNPGAGHVFQTVVPHGCWFAAEVAVPESFALLGCTVSPGFDFAYLEMATHSQLQEEYGRFATLIRRMTRS